MCVTALWLVCAECLQVEECGVLMSPTMTPSQEAVLSVLEVRCGGQAQGDCGDSAKRTGFSG